MPITVNDIQLLESERLTDEDNGGGRMTGSVVDSGEVNNLFPDISRLDRTYGRLSLRKAYMAVRSQNTDVYLGAHVIVTDPPDDGRVSTTLFTTGSPVDERLAAQNRIESYVTRGPLSAYVLFGTQPQGAKAITLFGRVETPLPEVGDVLVLSEEDSGGAVAHEQYVRVADVDAEERTFTDTSVSLGDYTRKVVTVTLTSALRRTFVGAEATRYSNVNPPTKVRTTTVADASRYFGVTRLAEAAAQDDLSITVTDVFSQLVPSTTREVPFAGAKPGQVLNFVAIGPRRTDSAGSGTGPWYFERGVLPRSVTNGSITGPDIDSDDGAGNLLAGSSDAGDIDYEAGRVSGANVLQSLTYTPAVAVQRSSYTIGVGVTLATQGTVYVQSLLVAPAPKTVRVDYRYLGKWYTLEDKRGDGALEGGNPGEGGGSVDYTSGDVVVTLGALPDIGSRVIFSAGQRVDFTQRTGSGVAVPPKVEAQLQQPAASSAGATLSWISGGVTKTATAAPTTGSLSGAASGTLSYADGSLTFVPSGGAWPDSNSTLVVDYTAAAGATGTVLGSYAAQLLQFTVPAAGLPLKAGGLVATIPLVVQKGKTDLVLIKDDGAGNIIAPATWNDGVENMLRGAIVGGTVDYATGAVSVQIGPVSKSIARPYIVSTNSYVVGYEREAGSELPQLIATPAIRYWATSTAVASQQVSEEVSFPGILINLAKGFTDSIVPSSVWFTWAGRDYIDRQGKVFRDLDVHTGSVVEAGTINYQSGEVLLHNWGAGVGGVTGVDVVTMLTEVGRLPISYLVFRTPGAPIRPASLYLQAVRADTGTLITGTSTLNGPISSAYMEGTADHNMGWVEVRFGEYVPAAGNENEPWYHPDNVVGGNVFKPIPVDPNSIEFNCVVLTNLPLDAELLGIDPVRLPQTGKVPIIRDGDVVVVHESREQVMPQPLGSGQVVTLPDAPVNRVALVDATGAAVPLAQYTADVVAGRITMADPLDLTGLVEPLTAEYVVEDMVLASSVELSGKVSLVGPLSRSYGAGALVSSALLFGDLRAANPVFFSQQTWQGEYLDDRNGSNTTAQYNRTLYPLELVNVNAVTERWALIFTSPTSGNIVGETLGVIGTFTTSADVQPLNPVTGQPYFILRTAGWGSGWSTNNVLRFNTTGPNAPIWIARTVLPGAQGVVDDQFQLQMRGDAD